MQASIGHLQRAKTSLAPVSCGWRERTKRQEEMDCLKIEMRDQRGRDWGEQRA